MGIYKTKEESTGDKHCDYNNFKRPRYFHGMLMTDRDFKEEQLYHNEKRKLLNQMLHGWGVVCRLKVKPTVPPGPNIIVEPGLALDCHGNEILVCEEQTIDLSAKVCTSTHADPQTNLCDVNQIEEQPPTTLYVMIKYQERTSDPVSVYAPGGSCEEKVCDYSRTQEGYCIEVWDSLPNNYMPPPVTLESGEATCMEPFPCPDTNCCLDPHYILLATISCGPRMDGTFGRWDPTKEGSVKIRYWIKRTLDKVCIEKSSSTDKDKIKVTDIYAFDIEASIGYQSINWEVDWEKLQNNGLSGESLIEKESDRGFTLEYQIWATTNSTTGREYIGVPVKKLTFIYNQGNKIIWETELPVLKSPVEIGTTDVKRGKTISEAMIRNEGHRKYVPTSPWFAWLLAEMGVEGVPWSGDVSVLCTAKVACSIIRANVTRAEVMGEVAKVKEDLRKEIEAKMEDAIKKIEREYRNKLAEMDNAIKKLEGMTKK